MQKIPMSKISKRSSDIIVECENSEKYNSLYQQVLKSYSFENAKKIFESWNMLHGDPAVCAHKCIALYEYCTEQEPSCSRIITLGNIISENIAPKLRDGDQTREYVKRKIARFKTRLSTKINKKTEANANAVNNTIDKFTAAIHQATGSSIHQAQNKPNMDAKKEEAILKAYETMESVLDEMAVCDTILNNQNKISNRFNLNTLVSEQADMEDLVFKICECIDTYRMGLKYKYNVALQNIPYTLYTNGIMFEMGDIANKVTDYFLMSSPDPDIPTMRTVLEHNMAFLFEKSDIEGLSYMFKDIAKLDIKFDDTMVLIHEVDTSKVVAAATKGKEKIKDMIEDYKKSSAKSTEKLKSMLVRIYAQPADQIIDEYPDILGIIRQSVILVGGTSINPILAIVGLCVDYAIKLELNRKQMDKYIEKHKKEIEKVDKKIEKAKTEEAKENLLKYKKSLESGLDKLKDYRDKLYSEEEAEKIRDKEMEDEMGDDDDIDFGSWDDDFDIDFDESAQIIGQMATLAETISETFNPSTFSNIIYSKGNICSEYALQSAGEFALKYLDESYWNYFISNAIDPLYGMIIKESTSSMKGDEYIRHLEKRNVLKELTYTRHDKDEDRKPGTLSEEYARLSSMVHGYNEICSHFTSLQEGGSVKETIRLAGINLKNAIRGLSDKEKALSRTVDANLNTFGRSAERALMNDNREAVIRGSLIPSASKLIKGAIISGAVWYVDPALAVIGVLGSIAISKSLQAKERQMILDEIEIELKMTDKYLRIAEDNNDMKATRQLLRTQRDLQRQQQRIKYRMKVYHNQTTGVGPAKGRDSSADDDD